MGPRAWRSWNDGSSRAAQGTYRRALFAGLHGIRRAAGQLVLQVWPPQAALRAVPCCETPSEA